jgi:DNA processing protein
MSAAPTRPAPGAHDGGADGDVLLGHALALGALDGLGPVRLGGILRRWHPVEAWERIRRGGGADLLDPGVLRGTDPAVFAASLAAQAADLQPSRCLDDCRRLGLGVAVAPAPWTAGLPVVPAALLDDPAPPALLVWAGDLDGVLTRPAVAVVGTRRATGVGRSVAHELGAALAADGVAVVSGLARGVDAAAHAGALTVPGGGPPIAVIASGHAALYPREHTALAREVAERGVVLSEVGPRSGATRWRFPQRNRLIAALAAVVVVVESDDTGGSLITVDEAVVRGRPVMAVPGSVRSPQSRGTNRLIAEGALVARDALDVRLVLGLVEPGPAAGVAAPIRSGPTAPDGPGDPLGAAIVATLGTGPAALDALAEGLGVELVAVACAASDLEADGWVTRVGAVLELAPRPTRSVGRR